MVPSSCLLLWMTIGQMTAVLHALQSTHKVMTKSARSNNKGCSSSVLWSERCLSHYWSMHALCWSSGSISQFRQWQHSFSNTCPSHFSPFFRDLILEQHKKILIIYTWPTGHHYNIQVCNWVYLYLSRKLETPSTNVLGPDALVCTWTWYKNVTHIQMQKTTPITWLLDPSTSWNKLLEMTKWPYCRVGCDRYTHGTQVFSG